MKKLIFLSLTLAAVIINQSCKKNNFSTNCTDAEQIIPFDSLTASQSFWLKNIDKSKNEISLVIRSQKDYEKYIGSNKALPTINFSSQFLIAHQVKLATCGRLKEQKIVLACDNLKYIMEIERELCQKPTDVFSLAIIDKKYNSYNIDFEILTPN